MEKSRNKESIVFSTDGTIRRWASSAKELLGYRKGEMLTTSFFDLVPTQARGALRRVVDLVSEGGTTFPCICLFRHENGEVISVPVTFELTESNADTQNSLVCCTHNDPASLVDLETRRESLHQQQQFLRLMSHQLRNPLMNLATAATVLKQSGNTQDTQDVAVDSIQRQVERLSRCLEDLLDASRTRRDKIDMRTSAIDLRIPLRAALKAFEEQFQVKNLNMRVRLPDEPVMILGDEYRLRQLAKAILENAAVFTPQNGNVSVELYREDGLARFRVKDDGVGLLPATLARVFEPFFRGSDAVIEEQESGRYGLGLGLAIAKSIAEGHGGDIEVFSAGRGAGAEFVLALPLADMTEKEEADSGLMECEESSRILLVDDERDGRQAVALLLRRLGYTVVEAGCGQDALDACQSGSFDVVVLDIGLPDMSGLDVCRQLRAMQKESPSRLIALSGYGRQDDLQTSQEAGFDLHLVKPISFGLLKSAIQGELG